MRASRIWWMAASLVLLAAPSIAQNVKLAGVAIGMSEDEVRAALAPHASYFVRQDSETADLYYLVAEAEEESFALTFMDGKVEGFSLMHILPAGQQPFLPAGQEPTVAVLRDLVIKQTWTPASVQKGDTLWLSDAAGAPLADASRCGPKSGTGWWAFGPVPGAKLGEPAPKSTEGLMKPGLVEYPPGCGVSIRLHETPGESEDGRVTSVRIQVLDMKAVNRFLAKHPQR